MIAIFTVLIVLALSILITRIATVALTHTGISRQSAAFQARSAFTGVGFTTGEAENVVDHPVRRRIIGTLMLLGNVGIITGMASLIISFVNVGDGHAPGWVRLGILAGGVLALLLIARSAAVDRWLSAAISWALDRWTRLEIRDYEELLHLSGNYRVRELRIEEEDWLANCTLAELRLREEGVTVLGIEKGNGDYVGVPRGESELEPGDRVLLYGRAKALTELDERRTGAKGDTAHREAVAEEDAIRRHERQEQSARERNGRTESAP